MEACQSCTWQATIYGLPSLFSLLDSKLYSKITKDMADVF